MGKEKGSFFTQWPALQHVKQATDGDPLCCFGDNLRATYQSWLFFLSPLKEKSFPAYA